MTALAEACTDLAAWYAVLDGYIAHPDTDGTTSRSKPGSRPPCNPAVANAKYDAHAAVRTAERQLRRVVTGTILHRGGSDANTLAALDAIPRLAEAIDAELAGQTARALTHLLTRILQLPAIDLEQRPRVIDCPRCQRKMLRYWENRDEVACCGCMQRATISIGYVSGEPILTWADGWMP